MNNVFLGLGSNLSNPYRQLCLAIKSLHKLPRTNFITHTPIERSLPWGGMKGQPDYYNCVVHLKTSLLPIQLLNHCQSIENQQGRVRKYRWCARTLDIDILLYEDWQVQNNRLSIPHPLIEKRPFVLLPLKSLGKF